MQMSKFKSYTNGPSPKGQVCIITLPTYNILVSIFLFSIILKLFYDYKIFFFPIVYW